MIRIKLFIFFFLTMTTFSSMSRWLIRRRYLSLNYFKNHILACYFHIDGGFFRTGEQPPCLQFKFQLNRVLSVLVS